MNPRSTFSSVNGIIKALMVEEIVRDNNRDHVDYWDYYNTLAHFHISNIQIFRIRRQWNRLWYEESTNIAWFSLTSVEKGLIQFVVRTSMRISKMWRNLWRRRSNLCVYWPPPPFCNRTNIRWTSANKNILTRYIYLWAWKLFPSDAHL